MQNVRKYNFRKLPISQNAINNYFLLKEKNLKLFGNYFVQKVRKYHFRKLPISQNPINNCFLLKEKN